MKPDQMKPFDRNNVSWLKALQMASPLGVLIHFDGAMISSMLMPSLSCCSDHCSGIPFYFGQLALNKCITN